MKAFIVLTLLSLNGVFEKTEGGTGTPKNRVIYELTDKNVEVAIKKNFFVVICFCEYITMRT